MRLDPVSGQRFDALVDQADFAVRCPAVVKSEREDVLAAAGACSWHDDGCHGATSGDRADPDTTPGVIRSQPDRQKGRFR